MGSDNLTWSMPAKTAKFEKSLTESDLQNLCRSRK
jgi:hypothetical protein